MTAVLSLFLGFILSFCIVDEAKAAADVSYYQRVSDFLKMDKYKDGAHWDGNSRDIHYQGWGCNAYARDFVYYCWKGNPSSY